jgi:thiosulfate/3-mercaptopyruvate sulfurtransferase
VSTESSTSSYASAEPSPQRPVVDVDWLAAHLGDAGLVVLDASIPPNDPGGLRIPGARRFDLEGAFSAPDAPLPHTMPTPEAFQAEARRLGVRDGGTVVVYDIHDVYSAARAWWMFRAMGLDRVWLLDGGLEGWEEAQREVEPIDAEEATRDDGGDFVARPVPGAIVDADAVAAALAGDEVAVVDARSATRFAGTASEPRPGLRSGHMPGAGNLPYLDVQTDGHLMAPDGLAPLVEAAAGGRDRVIFTCGSGVTACVAALASVLAGRDPGRLAVYDGSWTEWGAEQSGRPVESA